MKVALIDMDGCVADVKHRVWIVSNLDAVAPHRRQEMWDMFHSAMEFDEPARSVINVVNSLSSDVLVVILTGRPEKYKAGTLEQLTRWKVRHDHLIMRKEGDRQSSVNLKKQVVMHMMEIGLEIVQAIDDREDICDMYRELEIPTVEIKQ